MHVKQICVSIVSYSKLLPDVDIFNVVVVPKLLRDLVLKVEDFVEYNKNLTFRDLLVDFANAFVETFIEKGHVSLVS